MGGRLKLATEQRHGVRHDQARNITMAARGRMKWLRLALAGLLPLAVCAAEAAPTPKAARPAMWKVADSDTTIYLFGTIHLLPQGPGWRTPAMEAALAGAHELVLEVADIDDMMASARAMAKLGMSPGLPPIAERVPEGEARRAEGDDRRERLSRGGVRPARDLGGGAPAARSHVQAAGSRSVARAWKARSELRSRRRARR